MEIKRTLTLYSSCLSLPKKSSSQKCPHAHVLAQHPDSGPLFTSSRGKQLPAGAQPGCPGLVVLVFVSAVSADQWITAVRSMEQTPCLTSLWALTGPEQKPGSNPLKLWGIWNLDPDLKPVVGLPSPGFQLEVGFINTSATAFFCCTPPWIRSYCYEI